MNTNTTDNWKKFLPTLLQHYELNNGFNADETRLFYNLLRSKTISMKGEPSHGGEESKECVWCDVTVLMVVRN